MGLLLTDVRGKKERGGLYRVPPPSLVLSNLTTGLIIQSTNCTHVALCVLQRMKAIHPAGVIRLAGYSFGACVAMEMALQLQQQQSVQSLTLLDASHSTVAVQIDGIRDRMPFVTTDNEIIFMALFSLFVLHHAQSEVCCFYITA